jgi:dipeptidyl aminopeptidase/acylaminoacyl peptidase
VGTSGKSVVGARVSACAVLGVGLVLAGQVATATAALPGQNGRIAFTEIVGDDTTNAELQTIRPSGKGLQLISTQGFSPAFSPQGRRLVYSAWYDSGLWVRPAEGRGPARRLTRRFDYASDWSPNGRRIVFTRESAASLQVRIFAGGGSRRLAVGGDPAWSVEGENAFVGADGIFGIRANGSRRRLIVRGGSQPDWSPDGRRLAFVRGGRISIASARGKSFAGSAVAWNRPSRPTAECWPSSLPPGTSRL